MFNVRVLEELQEYSAALDMLEMKKKNRRILNPLRALEVAARLNSKLKRIEMADGLWRELIELNPNNEVYYIGLMQTHDIDIGLCSFNLEFY